MLTGPDLSSYQSDLDVTRITADFVIIKATESTNYINPYCNTHYQQAISANKLRGVYHFARLGWSAAVEADFFINNTLDYVGDSIPILDYEPNPPPASGVQWTLDWCNRVKTRTGIKPWVYMNAYTAASFDWSPVYNNDHALWIAQYGPEPSSSLWGGKSFAAWQYTDKGMVPGFGRPLDMNYFYGDRAAWNRYATGTNTPTIDTLTTLGEEMEGFVRPSDAGPPYNDMVYLVKVTGNSAKPVIRRFVKNSAEYVILDKLVKPIPLATLNAIPVEDW